MLRFNEMKAHVEDGQIVLDEPMNFPNGMRLRVVPDEEEHEMSASEQKALNAEIEKSLDEVDAGHYVKGDDLIARLRTRSA